MTVMDGVLNIRSASPPLGVLLSKLEPYGTNFVEFLEEIKRDVKAWVGIIANAVMKR
jgi:hypothetical protein